MDIKINRNIVFIPSEKVVPRKIKDKLIIVPIEDGVADFNDAMFSFNETGTKIWECIEQRKSLQEIVSILSDEYNADTSRIEQGVLKLVTTLVEKGIIKEWKN